jgi:hypothetical protein
LVAQKLKLKQQKLWERKGVKKGRDGMRGRREVRCGG